MDHKMFLFRICSRSLRAAVSCVRTERRNRSLHGVNEDFEHRPSANGSGAVDLGQVLRILLLGLLTIIPPVSFAKNLPVVTIGFISDGYSPRFENRIRTPDLAEITLNPI